MGPLSCMRSRQGLSKKARKLLHRPQLDLDVDALEDSAFRIADQLGKGFGEEPYRGEHRAIMGR